MAHDPLASPPSAPAMPPVDQVIHDIRESSGHLRAPEATEPPRVPATPPVTGSEISPVDIQAPAVADAHGAAAHSAHVETSGDGHDAHDVHDDAHGHGEALGPIDVANWSAGLLGVAVAALIAVGFVLATQGLGAY